jgi:hypothetical protein
MEFLPFLGTNELQLTRMNLTSIKLKKKKKRSQMQKVQVAGAGHSGSCL